MRIHRVFVVRTVRRTSSAEVTGVVEHIPSRRRIPFRDADGLWKAIAGSPRRQSRPTDRDDSSVAMADSSDDKGSPQRSR